MRHHDIYGSSTTRTQSEWMVCATQVSCCVDHLASKWTHWQSKQRRGQYGVQMIQSVGAGGPSEIGSNISSGRTIEWLISVSLSTSRAVVPHTLNWWCAEWAIFVFNSYRTIPPQVKGRSQSWPLPHLCVCAVWSSAGVDHYGYTAPLLSLFVANRKS